MNALEQARGGGFVILLIDNHDSFSCNLYQLVGALNPDIRGVRNDEYPTLRGTVSPRIHTDPGWEADTQELYQNLRRRHHD